MKEEFREELSRKRYKILKGHGLSLNVFSSELVDNLFGVGNEVYGE